MTWNDLVKIYDTEENSYKKMGIFILPDAAEKELYKKIIK